MTIKIALAGNPNSGKTTMFNELTGSSQYVGNWPGVTVEKKEGKLKEHEEAVIQDLPGIYSLSPYTLEEIVARDYLVGERPDAILNIVDGTNIERNLIYANAGARIRTVVALNRMTSSAKTATERPQKREARAARWWNFRAQGEGQRTGAEAYERQSGRRPANIRMCFPAA